MNKFRFSDVNFMAGAQPTELVFDSDSINQNIAAILDTPKGSKWFRPEIGSNVHRYLFEPIDDITSDRIRSEIESALSENGETRVVFQQVDVLPDPQNEQYYVNIQYRVPALEDREFSYQFNLQRDS